MPSAIEPVRFGVLGVGRIAKNAFAPAAGASPLATLYAAASRDFENARSLGAEQAYGTYDELLDDEQVEAVTAIVREAATELRSFHDARYEVRDAWSSALVSADRAALEARRTEALAVFDEASQRVVAALGDVAEVLTPEQRQRLAEAHAHHAHD